MGEEDLNRYLRHREEAEQEMVLHGHLKENGREKADDVNTPSSVSLNGDMPKDCCQLHNEVENSIPLSDHQGYTTSSAYSTSTVSLTSTSNTWFGNTIGSRRERYRSFSTPEGCSTASDDVRGSSTSFLSSINFSKSMVHPLSAKQIHSRSVRSSHADELCNGLHLDFSTNSTSFSTTTSPLKSRMHSTDAVFEKLTHYSTPVSSPASITLSDDLSENEFSNFSTIRPLSLPNPLSRSHHHHFWHHPKCPHYQIHRDSQDSGLGTVSPSSSKVSVISLFIPFIIIKMLEVDVMSLCFKFVICKLICTLLSSR
ncbi:unnamed protein product [Trichobilharzia regenti]|nr:unnamed protein product [Trichobilharzia regenti]